MKKHCVYFMAGVLMISSLAGCGKEKPEEILQATVKNTKEFKSVAGNMEMEMAVDVSQSGVSMGVELGISGDWEMIKNPSAFHFDGEVYFNMMDMCMDVEMYGIEEDKILNLYMKAADQWTHAEQSLEEVEKAQEEADMTKVSEEILKSLIMDEETKKTKEKELYVFRTELTGEEISSWIPNDMEEISREDLEEAGISDLEMDVELTIDKEKKLPAGFTLDLGESIQKLLDTALKETAEATGQTVDAEINNCSLTIEFHNFDNIEKIELPEEAKSAESISGTDILSEIEGKETDGEVSEEESEPEAAIEDVEITPTEEPQDTETEDESFEPEMPKQTADGAYILEDYDGTVEVSIKTPEGYSEGYMDKNYLTYTKDASDTDASLVSVAYNFQKFDEYYTEQDCIEAFLSQEENAEDYGYKSMICNEPVKIKTGTKEITCLNMDFSYDGTDKNRQITLWFPLKDEYYLQCTVSENVLEGDYTTEGNEELAKLLFDGVMFESKKVIN